MKRYIFNNLLFIFLLISCDFSTSKGIKKLSNNKPEKQEIVLDQKPLSQLEQELLSKNLPEIGTQKKQETDSKFKYGKNFYEFNDKNWKFEFLKVDISKDGKEPENVMFFIIAESTWAKSSSPPIKGTVIEIQNEDINLLKSLTKNQSFTYTPDGENKEQDLIFNKLKDEPYYLFDLEINTGEKENDKDKTEKISFAINMYKFKEKLKEAEKLKAVKITAQKIEP